MLGSMLSLGYPDKFLLSAGRHLTLSRLLTMTCSTQSNTGRSAVNHLEVDVWMENLCFESHIRSYQRVLFRNLQDNLKYTTLKRGFFGSLQTNISACLLRVLSTYVTRQ